VLYACISFISVSLLAFQATVFIKLELIWIESAVFLYKLDLSRRRFALNLPRKDVGILVGLLTGRVDLNQHLHIMGLCQDSICPLCQEEEDATAHFIAHCSALMLLWKNILGETIFLSLDTLSNIHWFLLLKFAKASSKRFYWPCGLSGLHIGPVLWPQCWMPAHTAIHPAGKVR